MPRYGGGAGSSINPVGLIVGCVLLVLLFAFVFQHVRKRNRSLTYHPPLQLQQSSEGVIKQIEKRKVDLHRYIGKLKEQLAAREKQLQYHDELEKIVTSRMETSRRDQEEWPTSMNAGKKIHGNSWNTSKNDETTYRDLQFQEYKRLLHDRSESSQSRAEDQSWERKTLHRPSKSNLSFGKLQPVAPLKPDGPKFVPAQWQSTRPKASARLVAAPSRSEQTSGVPATQRVIVPPLNWTRLGRNP